MRIKKLLPALLSCVFVLTSCGGGSSESFEESVEEAVFMENGYCPFTVIIPADAEGYESYAATEFTSRIQDASEIALTVIEDDQEAPDGHYLSLGDTKQFEAACGDVDLSGLATTQSAYYRTTIDGNIYIRSGDAFSSYGVLYGVYDLLEELCAYDYLASDEIYVESTKDMTYKKYVDHFVYPSFDSCTVSTYALMADATYCRRMRNIMPGVQNSPWNASTWGHGQIGYFVPYEVYGEEHPDWYMNGNSAPNSNQLCLSAGSELEDVVVEKFCQFLTEDTNATYFMFAQQDIPHGCTCEKCLAAISDWAMNYQGIQVGFLNRIIPRVEAWIAENQPGREIYYVVYGYQHTYQPPVVQNDDGSYSYYSDEVIPNEKIRFMVAPVDANYAYTFTSPVNHDLLVGLERWQAYAAGRFIIYMYDVNFKYYFINFNNFGSFKSNLETVKEMGAYYYLTNACSDTYSGCFNELRTYVESRLSWDLSRDPEVLTKVFFERYYKDAAPALYKVFEAIRDQYAVYETLISKPRSGNIYANILSTDLWPYNSVRQMENNIFEAFDAIEHYETDDPSLYETLKLRIYKEYLSVIYLKVKLYKGYCTDEELARLEEIWDTYIKPFGITRDAEGQSLEDIF